MAIYQYDFPTRIDFGSGAVRGLPTALRHGARLRPLLITDRGLAPLPPVTKTTRLMEQAGLQPGVFSGLWGNPVKSQVTAGVEAFRAHAADAVVAIGGGAAIDVAKAVALMVHHPGDLFDYESGKPDAPPMNREIPTFMTVPTTAGTGSEVGRSTVISDDETKQKKIIFSPRLLAMRVFVDPDLTLDLPATVTAATGMDALTHLAESYLAKGYHPLCDGIALEGLRLCARGLAASVAYARRIETGERALREEEVYRQARGLMMNAALMGGVAFQKGLGVTHSMAHALSTVCDLHHGLANGICISYAMAWNSQAVPDRMADLAAAVGARPAEGGGFVTWLQDLKATIGIPRTLADVGIESSQIPRLVEVALADGCHANNPRAASADDFRALFTEALTAA
jgi:alcohol dehydrogenase class IV